MLKCDGLFLETDANIFVEIQHMYTVAVFIWDVVISLPLVSLFQWHVVQVRIMQSFSYLNVPYIEDILYFAGIKVGPLHKLRIAVLKKETWISEWEQLFLMC